MERLESLGGQQKRSRGVRRAVLAATMFTFPIAAMAWIGCSSDSAPPSGITVADPGGTYGAEVQVVVSGRGRVQSASPGINCPGSCFTKYIFDSAAADGAAGGIALKAIPTQGASFKGWHFDTSPVGAGGRGPDNCNPVQRPGSDPGATSQTDVTLPFGQTNGTPPAGQEGVCGAYTAIPLVYRVTATFDPDLPPPPDSGLDAGGPSEILYQPVAAGTFPHNLGLTSSGYLYWTFDGPSGTGIAYGSFPSGSAPQSATTVVGLSSANVTTSFKVEPAGVVYQTPLGLSTIRSGSSTPTSVSTTAPLCSSGVALDSSNNVYCRASGTIYRWSYPSYTTQQPLFTSVPSGNDLIVESSIGNVVIGTTSAIASLGSFIGPDAGVASTTTIAPAIAPTVVRYSSLHYWWLDVTGEFEVSSTKATSTTSFDTGLSPSTGYASFSTDPSASNNYWVADGSTIYRLTFSGGSTTIKVFRNGLRITGLAVDFQYVYWGDGTDGAIHRASHSSF